MTERVEAVVIGTGFGGAVTGCRLAKRWPGKVLILERGKRYPMGSFPRSPHDMARNFWHLPDENKPHPKHVKKTPGELHGLFDVRNYARMDVVTCAGLGGGSLIYANVFMEPPARVFDDRWPATVKKSGLQPYYTVAKDVLGARPVPDPTQKGRREIIRTQRFQEAAQAMGRTSQLTDIMVFFGNNHAVPLDMGLQDRNRYGVVQTSCTYCAECDIGCNLHAKNTLDLNYLHVAEHRHGADVRTEHLATRIVPVNAQDRDDPGAGGENGYRVAFRDLAAGTLGEVIANRVVVSAGTLGSTELLLRCKERDGTLPRISDELGQRFSGNGDFLVFAFDSDPDKPVEPTYGPVITQYTDHGLFDGSDPKRAFIMEDASFPPLAAWLGEGLKPRYNWAGPLWRVMHSMGKRFLAGNTYGSFTYALRNLLQRDMARHMAVMLCMGVDESNGVMTLDRGGELELRWPYRDSISLYEAILDAAKGFARQIGARNVLPLPSWLWPFRNNITVHPLGGCFLGTSAASAVTSSDPATFGQVYNYTNLFVADGALCPSAVGANPSATIAALSERVAEGITGLSPSANL